jgi:hypothetical protein
MNNKKWINYLLIVIVLPLCAFCCDLCPHDHMPCIPKNTLLVWDSLFTANLDNKSETVIVSANDSVPKEAYGIRLNFKIQPYISQPIGSDTCTFLIPVDTITDIKIYTTYDFDTSHPANSEVSDYFKIGTNETNYNSSTTGYSYNTFSTIKDYLISNEDQSKFYQIDFLLLRAPQLNVMHKFKVEIIEKHATFIISGNPVILY